MDEITESNNAKVPRLMSGQISSLPRSSVDPPHGVLVDEFGLPLPSVSSDQTSEVFLTPPPSTPESSAEESRSMYFIPLGEPLTLRRPSVVTRVLVGSTPLEVQSQQMIVSNISAVVPREPINFSETENTTLVDSTSSLLSTLPHRYSLRSTIGSDHSSNVSLPDPVSKISCHLCGKLLKTSSLYGHMRNMHKD